MGSLFIKRFAEALDTQRPSLQLLNRARDALAGRSPEDEDLCLHLRAYAPLLDRCLDLLDADLDLEATLVLDILFFALYNHVPTTAAFVSRYCKLMQGTAYLSTASYRHPDPAYTAQCTAQARLIFLEIIASAQELKLDTAMLGSHFFLSSPKLLEEIHKTVLDLSTKRVGLTVSMAWGMFLHHYLQRMVEGEQHDATYGPVLDTLFNRESSEPYRYLIELAIESNVYENVVEICEALPSHAHDEKYRVILLDFFHATVPYIQLSSSSVSLFNLLVKSRALAQIAWQAGSTSRMLDATRQHFPHDHAPLLQMLKALSLSGTRTIAFLEQFKTFTQTMPTGFKGYTVTAEEAGQTLIELTQSLVLFAPRTQDGKVKLEPGTRGLIISAGATPVVLWHHTYHPLFFLARILHAAARNRTVLQHRDLIMDVLVIFAHIVASCEEPEAFLQGIADETSEDLEQSVFEIFEQALVSKTDTGLATECARFFGAVFPVLPETVWAFVAKLPLFAKDGQAGLLMAMVMATEHPAGEYTLLHAILKLIDTGLDTLVAHALAGESRLQEAKATFLLGAVRCAAHVFQCALSWPHADSKSRHALGTACALLFSKILSLACGAHLQLAGRLAGLLRVVQPAAQFLQETFCQRATQAGALVNLEEALQAGVPEAYTTAVLQFSIWLLQTAPQDAPSALHKALYAKLPQLAGLLSSKAHTTLLDLMSALVGRSWGAQTPSVLAHLGQEKHVLRSALWQLLAEEASMTEVMSRSLWGLLAQLMHPEQEGIALYLLTEEKPSDKDKSKATNASLLEPIRKHVEAVQESTWSPKLTSDVLTVLAAAQTWPSIVFDQLKGDTKFWSSMQALLETAQGNVSNQSDEVITVRNAYRLQCAGLTAQILASYLNAIESDKRISMTRQLLELLDALPRSVFVVDHYRASLHGHLGRNIAQKFSDFNLQALSKAAWRKKEFGESFLYDMALAEPMIRTNAFMREVRIANFNLSLLDAQLQCTHGLHILLAATVEPRIFDEKHFKLAFSAAKTLLTTRESFEMPMLHGLQVERCVTARLVIKSLAASKMEGDWLELLGSAIALAANLIPSGTQQLAGTQLAQTRPVLQTCCEVMTLISSLSPRESDAAVTHRLLLTLFRTVICTFAPVILVQPDASDLALTTAICCAIAALLERYNLARLAFAQELVRGDIITRALHLFASADPDKPESLNLACAAISLLEQILEVCPGAAEPLLSSGLLAAFLEARVTVPLRAGDIRHALQPGLHRLWCRCILPLSLSLVRELGQRMRADLSTLVEAFAAQIETCFGAWQQQPTKLSLSVEVCDELLMSVLLVESLNRMMDVPNEAFATSKTQLAARIEYMLTHPKTTAAAVQPATEEMQGKVARRIKEMKELIEAL